MKTIIVHDSIMIEEESYIDSETSKRLHDQLRSAVGPIPAQQGQYIAIKYPSVLNSRRSGKYSWFEDYVDNIWKSEHKPLEIPKSDFYETISPENLEYCLEKAAYGPICNPRLFLLYLDIKQANQAKKGK